MYNSEFEDNCKC